MHKNRQAKVRQFLKSLIYLYKTEVPCKKRKMAEKMPVTMLQEYCVQRKCCVPYYEELGEDISEGTKVFNCRVSAFDKSAEGSGLNKKNAKHSAAASLLEKLGIKTKYCSDVEEDKSNTVLRLLDMCVERNWPLAKFEEIQATGQSHCPEFTFRCTLSSLVREAKAPKKKDAKQKAAQLMLQVIQEMNMHDPEKLKLMEMKDLMDMEEEGDEKIIKSYREYKKSDVKKQLGVKLCDRHNFFASLDQERVQEARRNLMNDNFSYEKRIIEMCHALKLKYKIESVPSNQVPLMAFELDHENYDCFFVAFADDFWEKLDEYFRIMLSAGGA